MALCVYGLASMDSINFRICCKGSLEKNPRVSGPGSLNHVVQGSVVHGDHSMVVIVQVVCEWHSMELFKKKNRAERRMLKDIWIQKCCKYKVIDRQKWDILKSRRRVTGVQWETRVSRGKKVNNSNLCPISRLGMMRTKQLNYKEFKHVLYSSRSFAVSALIFKSNPLWI